MPPALEGGTLDSTFPVVFRNGFFRDEHGALISDNEVLPNVFNYMSRKGQ